MKNDGWSLLPFPCKFPSHTQHVCVTARRPSWALKGGLSDCFPFKFVFAFQRGRRMVERGGGDCYGIHQYIVSLSVSRDNQAYVSQTVHHLLASNSFLPL